MNFGLFFGIAIAFMVPCANAIKCFACTYGHFEFGTHSASIGYQEDLEEQRSKIVDLLVQSQVPITYDQLAVYASCRNVTHDYAIENHQEECDGDYECITLYIKNPEADDHFIYRSCIHEDYNCGENTYGQPEDDTYLFYECCDDDSCNDRFGPSAAVSTHSSYLCILLGMALTVLVNKN